MYIKYTQVYCTRVQVDRCVNFLSTSPARPRDFSFFPTVLCKIQIRPLPNVSFSTETSGPENNDDCTHSCACVVCCVYLYRYIYIIYIICVYVVRAFDGPHLEFKMAGVAGLVRGRVVVIIMCQCFILFHFFFRQLVVVLFWSDDKQENGNYIIVVSPTGENAKTVVAQRAYIVLQLCQYLPIYIMYTQQVRYAGYLQQVYMGNKFTGFRVTVDEISNGFFRSSKNAAPGDVY